jgi:MFS family permease
MTQATGTPSWRNVTILAAAQALAASAGPLVVLAGGIIGESLAPSPMLATLPITALVIGLACAAVPTSMLIRRIGRRATFVAGAAVSALAALVAARATASGQFWWFCAATFLMGAAGACVQQYRFAAAESVDGRHTGRAVSCVLAGGIIAGALGPEIGRRGQSWFDGEFTGAFVIVAVVQAVALALLTGLRIPPPVDTSTSRARVPARTFFAHPSFLIAVVGAASASAVMSFLMTAAPISMHVHDSHSIDDAAFAIQGHVIAMYAPSLLTGWLIDRLGVARMMTAGAIVIGGAVAAAASGHSVWSYWTGLVLLGLGWNLLFIGATVLLTRDLPPADRFRAQGLNDFTVFGSQAVASLAAGAVLHQLGWLAMNLAVVPILLLVLALIARQRVTGLATLR